MLMKKSLILFGALMVVFLSATGVFSGKAQAEGEKALKEALTRATVQCYAIEGRYPPSIGYLEENYGILVDKERYSVLYSGFASNVMPEITVLRLEE